MGSPITIEHRDGVYVLHVTGALDLETVDQLRTAACGQLDGDGCVELIIDAAELSFIDSTGIGCLVDISNRARSAGTRFGMTNLEPQVARVLDLVGMSHLAQ